MKTFNTAQQQGKMPPISDHAKAFLVRRFTKRIMPKIDYLQSRWSDEREYEDFNEYVEAVKTFMLNDMKNEFQFISCNKNFTIQWHAFGAYFETKFKCRSVETKQIKVQ